MARGWLSVVVPLSVLALLAVAPGWAWAADPAHGGEEKPNVFQWQLDLGIWTLVVFGLLMFVLGKVAWGPMLQGLHRREQNIQSAIDEAQKTRDEAQNLRVQLEKQLAGAHDKVREIVDEGRRAAQQMHEEMTGKARAEIQTERDRLRREIETAKDQALQELWNQSAQLATLISAKAIRRQLTPDDHRRLVDEALGELRQAGEGWQRDGGGGRL
jgi:F-type H+-transporting ATPase subunit b